MNWSKRPLVFDNNRITRSYIGGKLLHEWRGMNSVNDSHDCEELLVTSIGAICEGKPEGYAVSRTLEGVSLTDIINEDPVGILGEKYQSFNPNNLSVLARAGDTIVRLVMQCHPKKEDAVHFFNEKNGKAEAWYIARTRSVDDEDNCVYAGFKEDVTPELWKELIKKQDIPKMLACFHKISVKMGDVILIPAGMPHAVGPGCIFLEIHECSDITIRVEKNINGVTLSDKEMYNGLIEEEGLKLFDYTTYTEEEIQKVCVMEEKNPQYQGNSKLVTTIDSENTNAFKMQLIYIDGEFNLSSFHGHRVLVPVEGNVEIICDEGKFKVQRGWGCLLPANIGDCVIKSEEGKSKVLIGLPGDINE